MPSDASFSDIPNEVGADGVMAREELCARGQAERNAAQTVPTACTLSGLSGH